MGKFNFSGTLYTVPGTDAEDTGNSGWIKLPGPTRGIPIYNSLILQMKPLAYAGSETMDLDLNFAHDALGNGDTKYHDFTQVTSSNAVERLILPGGNSVAGTAVDTTVTTSVTETGTAVNSFLPVHAFNFAPIIPPFFKFSWTVANNPATGATITIYATLGSP